MTIGTQLCFYLVLVLKVSLSNALESDYSYQAAVVEYHSSSVINAETTAKEYVNIIAEIASSNKTIDIIIFPESTLSAGLATEVPKTTNSSLCDSSDDVYQSYFTLIACAAEKYNTYVSVNLLEQENCTQSEKCSESGVLKYNTNVVFDRNGSVVSRYRKWNLYGEYGLTTTESPEIEYFQLDKKGFFGVFTCFDLLFREPAIELTRVEDQRIKNIIFPTRWFSELPFLTALQAQQMWAQEMDMNLLSAGANHPKIGSTGTAILIGKLGPLEQHFISAAENKVIVQQVPRLDVKDNPLLNNVSIITEDVDEVAASMDSLFLKIDDLTDYKSEVLNVTISDPQEVIVCHDDLCCNFNVQVHTEVLEENADKNFYTYHMVAYSGVRTFSGVYNGGIEICGLVACTTNEVASCGRRFSNYSEVLWPTTFQNVSIWADFDNIANKTQFPNSLLSSLKPISPQQTSWSKDYTQNNTKVTRYFNLETPQNRLMTFAIFGRNFDNDSDPSRYNDGTPLSGNIVMFLTVITLILFRVTL